MKLELNIGNHGELARQARITRALGSPFIASVLDAGHRQLFRAPRTAALIAAWPGDPSAAALGMRFNAALNALARRGTPPSLQALYRRQHEDFDRAVGDALAAEDRFVADWMRDTPQTNEVGRAASLFPALMLLKADFGLPFELIEIGSSAGLNLNMARYAYDLGGAVAGDPASPVRVAPEWRGAAPLVAPVEVVSARGVDLRPLDPADPETAERLLSFVWADQQSRARRLEQALLLARRQPPQVECANAVPWVSARLAEAQAEGVCRVFFHSMVLQYLDAADRLAVIGAIRAAGSRATRERPLARIGFEWTEGRKEVRLMMSSWPDGRTRHLATCHPYGDWVDWHG
jgi:hypothetical protein